MGLRQRIVPLSDNGHVLDAPGGKTTLKITPAPVDSYHQPERLQAVEVLRTAGTINTERDYIAATTGIVAKLQVGYQPYGTVVIPIALDLTTTGSPQLFLRVWQDVIAHRYCSGGRWGRRA